MRPIFYDTETTGVISSKDRIVEIAAYDPLSCREFVSLVNPGIPIPPDATKIHRITDDMVKDAPNFAEVGKAFFKFCMDEEETVLIAHNNDQFDKLFLEAECKRHQIDFPTLGMVDSLKWSRKYRSDLPRHSLQYLREVYGFPANEAHRALNDVMVLSQIFMVMIDDLPLKTVMNLIYSHEEINVMPFGKHQGKSLEEVPKDYFLWLEKSGALEKRENNSLKIQLQKLGILQKAQATP